MQIPSIPPPTVGNLLPQDVATKVTPVLQNAAVLTANAVIPPPKSEKSNQSRRDGDRNDSETGDDEREGDEKSAKEERGHSVNIRV